MNLDDGLGLLKMARQALILGLEPCVLLCQRMELRLAPALLRQRRQRPLLGLPGLNRFTNITAALRAFAAQPHKILTLLKL